MSDRTQFNCTREQCDEQFESLVLREIHTAKEHGLPWEDIDGWPRSPSAR